MAKQGGPSPDGPWRIVHMSSVHIWNDTRVFHRMCRSLAGLGHDVHWVVPCSDRTEVDQRDGVWIHPVTIARNRLNRAWSTARQVCRVAVGLQADIYHFHDPELIPHALWLSRRGHRLIYDAHEDLPKDLLGKHWIPRPFRHLLAKPLDQLERLAAARLAAVVAAEEEIEKRFCAPGRETVTIHNYPPLADFPACRAERRAKSPYGVAFGGISRLRAIEPIVHALGLLPEDLDAKLILSGRCESEELLDSVRRCPGYSRADYRGWLSRDEMRSLLHDATVALILFSPAPNNRQVRSNRFYESLAASVPVITSDFPAWRSIVDQIGCGIHVDPQNPEAIAQALTDLLAHPEKAREMGARGRRAIEDRFNWECEQQKLVALYARLMDASRP